MLITLDSFCTYPEEGPITKEGDSGGAVRFFFKWEREKLVTVYSGLFQKKGEKYRAGKEAEGKPRF